VNILPVVFSVISFTCFAIGLLTLVFYPLAIAFALRRPKRPVFQSENPLVSVVVPAYNEGKVIRHCVDSVLASAYQNKEILLVDDGSTDDTLAQMREYETQPGVTVLSRQNGGKAAALNAGLAHARGEIVLFVDADGIFASDTIDKLLSAFESQKIGAVCGSDSPANLDRLLTRLANLQTHVGTGFARRALSLINCLPVVSGNLGAFRRSVLEKTGPFREGFIGEDLELTWRVHKAGYRVTFQPWATVRAETPSTLRGLWKQRVRWARGLLQTARIHRDMFFNPRYGLFAFYLGINMISMVLIPILQLASIVILPILAVQEASPVPVNVLGIIGWLGLGFAFAASVFSIALDRAWKDLRYLYVAPLWVLYSFFMDVVSIWALILEMRGGQARWDKLERTGVVSRGTSS
jgi:cellulose synthase/poly-beta-1,6-N-acetylglucosamine synthase-like glycosyltransferase